MFLILRTPIVWYNSGVKLILPLLLPRLKCALACVLSVVGLMALAMLIIVVSCGRNLLVLGKVAEGKGAVIVHVGVASADMHGCPVDYDVYRPLGCYESGRPMDDLYLEAKDSTGKCVGTAFERLIASSNELWFCGGIKRLRIPFGPTLATCSGAVSLDKGLSDFELSVKETSGYRVFTISDSGNGSQIVLYTISIPATCFNRDLSHL